MSDHLAGRLAQYVDNNRGIALLMTARTETDAPPDCVAFASTCREAAEAFAAAMAADPLNPVYPMNAAWVARLTGDADRATALIEQALEEGIPLVAAAHNDLGVLAARRGDLDGARAHFVRAIATDPGTTSRRGTSASSTRGRPGRSSSRARRFSRRRPS